MPQPTAPRRVVTDDILVPFTLALSPIRRLLVIDIADDPIYRGLEPQVLDRPDGHTGMVLLAYRHDGYVELYAEPGLEVDPSGYAGLGEGLAGIHPTRFERARFDVTPDGLQLDLTYDAPNGRSIDLHVHERLRRRRDVIAALAPVGGAFTAPEFFPFIWLPSLSFLPVRRTEVTVRVDGEERAIARLPLPLGGRRCLFARYDPEVMVCEVNPTARTEVAVAAVPDAAAPGGGSPDVEVVDVDGEPGLAGVRVRRGERTCSLVLDPALPDLRRMPPATTCRGTVTLSADGAAQLRGRYEVDRHDDHADLRIDHLSPWRPRPRRPLLAVLFRLPVFRRWPTTYRWNARLDLTTDPTLRSSWTRAGAATVEAGSPVAPGADAATDGPAAP